MQGSSSQLATFLMIFPLFCVYSGFRLYTRDNVKAIVTITYLKCQQERSKLIDATNVPLPPYYVYCQVYS